MGFLWFPVDSSLKFMEFLELGQLSTESARFLWIPMDSYSTVPMGSYRIPTDSYGFIRKCMDYCKTLSSSIPHNPRITSHDILALPRRPLSAHVIHAEARNRDTREAACVVNSVTIITQKKNCAPTYSQFAPQATVSAIKSVHLEETTVCAPTYYQDVAKRCDAQVFALRGVQGDPPQFPEMAIHLHPA